MRFTLKEDPLLLVTFWTISGSLKTVAGTQNKNQSNCSACSDAPFIA
jgi:hypothetical protein